MNKQLASYLDVTDSYKLISDELVEILEFTFPEVWYKYINLNQFIPSEKTLKKVINFFQELEDLKVLGKANGLKPNASSKKTTFK